MSTCTVDSKQSFRWGKSGQTHLNQNMRSSNVPKWTASNFILYPCIGSSPFSIISHMSIIIILLICSCLLEWPHSENSGDQGAYLIFVIFATLPHYLGKKVKSTQNIRHTRGLDSNIDKPGVRLFHIFTSCYMTLSMSISMSMPIGISFSPTIRFSSPPVLLFL